MAYILIIIGIICLGLGIYLFNRPAPDATVPDGSPSGSLAIVPEASVSTKDTTIIINNTREIIRETKVVEKTVVDDGLTDNERKGRQFEEWVVSQFPKPEYTIKEWRADKFKDGTYAESTRYPDLEVELKLKNATHLFAVECKYRSSISDSFEWTSQEKIDIYNKYAQDRHIPTFIIFGIGGTPSSPEEVIIAPLEKLQKPHVTEKYLRSLHHHDLSRTLYYYAKEKRLM
ncbi:MAG: hypothetical protein KBT39_07830 [Bacteroidales bacterium]|nr:hypothetical protein [Bacteroidales bacterium]